jgi:hypothetical protein
MGTLGYHSFAKMVSNNETTGQCIETKDWFTNRVATSPGYFSGLAVNPHGQFLIYFIFLFKKV